MRILLECLTNKSGNFGILTAIIFVPLAGAAGMALDYGRALSLHTDLMGLADAAALAAITPGSPGYAAIQTMGSDGEVQIAEKDGKNFFLAQRTPTSSPVLAHIDDLDVSVKVVRKKDEIISVASFSAKMPTTFMQLLGNNSVVVSGSATAVYGASNKNYADLYMLLDNTPSMGIAATAKDIKRMKEATKAENIHSGCEFACHVGWTGSDGKFNEARSTYNVARDYGITLRVDVVAKAAAALIAKAKEMSASSGQYRVAAYSFGKYALEPGYRIDRLTNLTLDMTSASKAVSELALMTTDHDRFNENALTSFDTALVEIGKKISGNGGAGSSAVDPQKIVYFVTDGVGNSLKPGGICGGSWFENRGRCIEPIDTKYCKALKDRDIKIAVLYTTYEPVDDHIWYHYIDKSFAHKIKPKLQECASPELFFEVKPDDNMEDAMLHLFARASASEKALRLTQ